MIVKKISEKEKVVSIWSGGITSQLYIAPENSVFAERNFDFRISSAVIEVEESDFTPMPGFSRILMVLDGELEISHEGHYSKLLKQFEVDEFSGDWKTSSKGMVVDFNLIMGEGISGSLECFSIGEDKIIDNNFIRWGRLQSARTLGYYLISGGIQINLNQQEYELKKGEMILIENKDDFDEMEINGFGELIEILIW